MTGLPLYVYGIDWLSAREEYSIAFWSPETGRCIYRAPIAFVPTEAQMLDVVAAFHPFDSRLEGGPSPHYHLYHQ